MGGLGRSCIRQDADSFSTSAATGCSWIRQKADLLPLAWASCVFCFTAASAEARDALGLASIPILTSREHKGPFSQIREYYRKIRKKIPIRKMFEMKPKTAYWSNRSELHYYQTVKDLVEEFSPGEVLMDVGAWDTPVIYWGDFNRRISIDLRFHPKQDPRVEAVVADWLEYKSDVTADLIVCLQVLEHIKDDKVKAFAEKIVRSGRWAIISVPYMWVTGKCVHHYQDPVDLKKLESWVGYPSVKYIIEDRDLDQRLIAVLRGCGAHQEKAVNLDAPASSNPA